MRGSRIIYYYGLCAVCTTGFKFYKKSFTYYSSSDSDLILIRGGILL
jgi:hypothetical protein